MGLNSIESVRKTSYPDFIGLINQWNTPPGSYSTISKLATFSNIDDKSILLEVGCSTGFSSRELSVLTGCRGVGIDISEVSIRMANYNKIHYAKNIEIEYRTEDGYSYSPDRKFSHIMVGGNLKFFGEPGKMMSRCVDFLDNEGYILATPYYEVKKLPSNIVANMHETLGIPTSAFSNFAYKDVMKMYNKFEIVYEERNDLIQETEEEMNYYCKSVINRACDIHSIVDMKIRKEMQDRLLAIRRLINSTRPFQKYIVLVLRYRKSIYPNRFTALF